MIHHSENTRRSADRQLPIGLNFSMREEGLVSCRVLDGSREELHDIILRLSGPSGARIERLKSSAEWKQLRWGGLTPGWWTAEADGLDPAGRRSWHAPQVRFRTADDGVAQVCLNFSRFDR